MEEEHKDTVPPNVWQRMNGTGGDLPTGYRPCPFCHAVIPWESERCPSCGRVLIERVGNVPAQAPPRASRSQRRAPWWTTRTDAVLARLRTAVMRVQEVVHRARHQINCSLGVGGFTRQDPWATTSRGTSWSVFQSTGRPVRTWWPRSLPRPTQRERQIFLVGAFLMVIVFVIVLLF